MSVTGVQLLAQAGSGINSWASINSHLQRYVQTHSAVALQVKSNADQGGAAPCRLGCLPAAGQQQTYSIQMCEIVAV